MQTSTLLNTIFFFNIAFTSLNLVSSKIILGSDGFALPKTIIFSTFNLVTISTARNRARSLSKAGIDVSGGLEANNILSIRATLTGKLTLLTHKLDKKWAPSNFKNSPILGRILVS